MITRSSVNEDSVYAAFSCWTQDSGGNSAGLTSQGLTLVPGMKPVLVLSNGMKVFPDTAQDGGCFAGQITSSVTFPLKESHPAGWFLVCEGPPRTRLSRPSFSIITESRLDDSACRQSAGDPGVLVCGLAHGALWSWCGSVEEPPALWGPGPMLWTGHWGCACSGDA